ncbi:nonsense-mediated mRNA decay factor SMG5-like [Tubulanus polymorphus]|uniref:nonsense-mediated mRNA decay factor SMG5-like n=1 Tax=Tubulanus polymorphus TaxID=672921 RepID=UPI003DA3B511
MKKIPGKNSDGKSELDKAKRLYRAVLDCIRRLDEILKTKKAYRDVFLSESIGLRNRLKDYCEQLMFYDPTEYGRRAEELLWRKVFYDIIQLLKNHRKSVQQKSSLEIAFRTHLAAATGYYHHLLLRIQSEFGLNLNILDFHYLSEPPSHLINRKGMTQMKRIDVDTQVLDWARKACHRCLIYLGDIARYQQDFDGVRSRILAQRYYKQALILYPSLGMPQNQLGTLAGNSHYSCSAAYFYYRCLMCEQSFEGAEGNLKRLFEKNRKKFTEVCQASPRDMPPEQQQYKDVKTCLVGFMHMMDVFHNNNGIDSKELQECCQTTLQQFNLCMYYQPPLLMMNGSFHGREEEKVPYLDDVIVYRLVVMCIMTVRQLQMSGSQYVTAAIAFTLALFSHVLNHVVSRLTGTLEELENPRKTLGAGSPLDVDVSSDDESAGEPDNRDDAKTDDSKDKSPNKSKKLFMFRRRRRNNRGSDLDSDESEDEGGKPSGGGMVVLSDSDEEEVMNFLDNTDSSNESDNLMESQELRPGFSENQDSPEKSDLESVGSAQSDLTIGGDSQHDYQRGSSDASLQAFSLEFFNNSDILPSLPFGVTSTSFTQGIDFNDDLDVYKDVIQGRKKVAVPPGFHMDPEARYVEEITEKIATFNIETDTDTSAIPTDTENSSLHTDADASSESSTGSVIDRRLLESKKLSELVTIINQEGLMPVVKVFCDWMICHPHILETTAQSSLTLWTRLSVLLNVLPSEDRLPSSDLCSGSEILANILKKAAANLKQQWTQTHPVCEDIDLQNLPPIQEIHSHIVFDPRKRQPLSSKQETLLRICCLRKFGYFAAKLATIPLTYNDEKAKFFAHTEGSVEADEVTQEKIVDTETKRNQLMRDMAQLRLQAEVNQLEGSLKLDNHPILPPYVVVDVTALCEGLDNVRSMINSARFIIIIPLAVIDNLDNLKKESSKARDAIRWLENEFKKGNRYVRAQKSSEKVNASPPKNLKRKDPDMWYFMQIINCCKYFAAQRTDCKPKDLVCLLTNLTEETAGTSASLKRAVNTVKHEGINVESVKDFYKKWKEATHSEKG